MKRIITFTLLTLMSVSVFSQPANLSTKKPQPGYLQKSLHQRNAARLLLWCGLATCITGAVVSQSTNYSDRFLGIAIRNDKKYNPTGDIIAFTGLTSMVGSIPLFIVAAKNKKRSMAMAVKNEQFQLLINQSFVSRSVPALSLKIKL